MGDAFEPASLASGGNGSSAQPPGRNSSLSFPPPRAPPGQPARTIAVAVIVVLGLAGNGLLLQRLRCGGCCCADRFARRRKMDFLLAHLAAADVCGCGLALLSQLPQAAGGEAAWPAGDATCRLFRLLQASALLAPAHMLVLLALERQHVGRAPPQPPSFAAARGALAALGWLLALLLALPHAFVYRLGPPQEGRRCRSVFGQLPPWHGQAYAAYGLLTSWVAPACLLGGTCGRILRALRAAGATEEEAPPPLPRGAGGSARHHLLPLLPGAKGASPSPRVPRTLPRARVRALQLTLALAALFALCGFPRFALELGLALASPAEEARTALGSILAATNCALNPYVCLLFHSYRPWARRLQSSLCHCPDGPPRRRAPHRHRPPPPHAPAPRPAALWLCPCQAKPPAAPAVVQQPEAEGRAAGACESGL